MVSQILDRVNHNSLNNYSNLLFVFNQKGTHTQTYTQYTYKEREQPNDTFSHFQVSLVKHENNIITNFLFFKQTTVKRFLLDIN